jgi:hypothetical protein
VKKALEPFSMNKDNNRLIEAAFSKSAENISSKEISLYIKSILKSYRRLQATRPILQHIQIQAIVGHYLSSQKWNVRPETPFADFDYNNRFDLMAKKSNKTIIVEVKSDITVEGLGQVLGYIFNVKRKLKNARVFLATDILGIPFIFNNVTIREIISDFAKRHGMGMILVDQDSKGNWETWLLPSVFLH